MKVQILTVIGILIIAFVITYLLSLQDIQFAPVSLFPSDTELIIYTVALAIFAVFLVAVISTKKSS